MKRVSFILLLVLWAITGFGQAPKVALVNDNNVTDEEYTTIADAIETAGYDLTVFDFNTMTEDLTYEDLQGFDMVIWYLANDRVAYHLWDTTAGAENVKFHPALQQYYNNADGAIWIDGIDILLPLLVQTDGSTSDYDPAITPHTFPEGSFIHDTLGIAVWEFESKTDEPNGIPEADKASANTINSLETLKWKWETLWRADGWTIVDDATPLYLMGPDSYQGAGYVMAYKYVHNNVKLYVSSLRVAVLGVGDGTTIGQDTINQVVSEILADAIGSVSTVTNPEHVQISVYPNPAQNLLNIKLPEANVQMTIIDPAGVQVMQKNITNSNAQLDVSNLAPGVYFIKFNAKNWIATSKFIKQ